MTVELEHFEAPMAEILLQNDKVELGEKYNIRISSRFQPLTATTAHYHFSLPTSEQNRRYTNVRPRKAATPRQEHLDGAGQAGQAGQAAQATQAEQAGPAGPAGQLAAANQQEASMSSSSRPTPLLTKLRMPEQEGMARLRQGVAYSISRLEEWFMLLDTNRSGEVTVRKLILGMMKHQAVG